jgi:zinc metalloprotease zmpC
MKKTLFVLLATAALAILSSCSEKTGPEKDTQLFDDEELTVNKPSDAAEGYKIGIAASETVTWTASLEETYHWITIDNATGKGDGEIVYSLAENTEIQPRTARIKVNAVSEINDFKSVRDITVVQIGTAPALLIAPSGEVEIPADENEAYTVEVTSNLDWTASVAIQSGEGEWIRIVSGQNGENSGNIVLSVTKNDAKDFRSAEITVSNAEYPELTQKLIVKQQFADMTYRISLNGVSGYVAAGEYTMSLSGYATPLPVNVFDEEGNTVIEYSELLEPGEYRVETLSGDSDYEIGASFILGENGVIAEIAEWSAALKMFGGTEKWPFMLGSYGNLVSLKEAVAAGDNFSGRYFAQSADIRMSEDSWDGIGSSNAPFGGIYDGNGFEIKDLYIHVNDKSGHGFFNFVQGKESARAAVRNLVIKGKDGADEHIISDDSFIASCIARISDYTDMTGCRNYANVRCVGAGNGSQKAGGMVGNAEGKSIIIENCINYGKMTATNSGANMNDCGGLIGNAKGSSNAENEHIIVRNCRNYGDCAFDGNSGGLLGNLDENTDIIRCANYGSVVNTKASMRVGALVGSIDVVSEIKVSECFNLGSFNGLVNSGGLIGFAKGDFIISDCYNRGPVTLNGSNSNNSGLLGHKNTSAGQVKNCYCAADFTPKGNGNAAGAIVGMNAAANVQGVSGCWYESDRGFVKGAGQNADASGVVEAKGAAWFVSGTPIDGWDTGIWEFKEGSYPVLKNNPED